jgi:hypothetical protein
MRRIFAFCLLLILVDRPLLAADLVVVVRADSEIGQLNRDDVINIFLGGYRRLASGKVAEPLDLGQESPVFYERLTGKTQAEINAYWARLLFTGRTSRPRAVDNPDKLIEILTQNPLAIGYLDRTKADRRMRVIFEQVR